MDKQFNFNVFQTNFVNTHMATSSIAPQRVKREFKEVTNPTDEKDVSKRFSFFTYQ